MTSSRCHGSMTDHRCAGAFTNGRIPTIHHGTTGIMSKISGRSPLGRPFRKAYQ